MGRKPIFFDATGRRSARVSFIAISLAVVSTILGGIFITTLFVVPHLAGIQLVNHYAAISSGELVQRAKAPGLLRGAVRLAAEARHRRAQALMRRRLREARAMLTRPSQTVIRPREDRPLTFAFYEPLHDTSFSDLKRELPHLDALLPTWMALQGPGLEFKSFLDKRAFNYVRLHRPRLALLPVIQNATLGVWDGKGMAALLADSTRRAKLIDTIVQFIAAYRLQGVTIDFEDLPASAYENQRVFLSELSHAFSPHNWLIVQAAPFDDNKWPYAAYAKIVDYTILMAYDQHDDSDAAGPIASQSWFETTLDKRMKVLSPRETVIAIGNYGYDWNGGSADSLTFEDAAIAAKESDAKIDFDDASNNPHFSYIEDDDTKHDVWFLDGVTAYNEIHAADIYQPSGYALWRLGAEDPSIWSVLGQAYGAGAPEALTHIATSQDVDFEGSGELLHIDAEPATGSRTLDIDRTTGDIDDETYTKVPTNYVIRQFGVVPHKVALSFDDGPDPVWTPKNSRHSEREARARDLLRHRCECRSVSRPRTAHDRRGRRGRQSHIHPSQSRRDAARGGEA